jgi:aromatic-L-amino-acid/L-tryptophan decarboxylase
MRSLEISDAEFRGLATKVATLTADYYQALPDARSHPAASGAQVYEAFDEPLPEDGLRAAAFDALGSVIDMSRAPTARFFGYVLGSGEPVAALGDLVASVLNQNVTAWRSAPAAVTIERQVLKWIAQALGCEGMTGSLCGGGSAANLMGLAMAREARLPANDSGAQPGIVYTSTEAHMSMAKAVALLGLGRRNLRLIPVDDEFRMNVPLLEAAIAEDRAAGRTPIAVVASAGTVSTGAIDPLETIAKICRDQGLWLHVDGAYGIASFLATPEKFRGLSEADSFSMDLHKWLYQPVDCGLLLFKDPKQARAAFSHTGEYARVLDEHPIEGFAFFEESMELSRRFRALKVWLSLRYHGMKAFRASIRADLEHAQLLAASVRATPQLELLAPVELSAVCFRYRADGKEVNELNAAILRRVIANGRVHISNALVRLLCQSPYRASRCRADRFRSVAGGPPGDLSPPRVSDGSRHRSSHGEIGIPCLR